MMYRKIFTICGAFALVLFAGFVSHSISWEKITSLHLARAASTDALSGYAYSETIGWVSFNCTTDPAGCGSSNYGVNIGANGNFSGYAWSENIGWISFNPPGPYPSDPQTSAKLNLVTGQVSGWARACAGSPNGDCTGGPGANANSGGWDGWIKLQSASGESVSYGVTYNTSTKQFQGFAWGSDKVGWLSFNCNDPGAGGCGPSGSPPNYYVGGNINTAPTVWNPTLGPALYCGGAAQTVSFTFSDAQDGSSTNFYEIQATSTGNFGSPDFDFTGTLASHVTNQIQSYAALVSTSPDSTHLAFNKTYSWRVRVYASAQLDSGWTIGPSFRTPRHAYPQPAFTPSPASPSAGQVVTFNDQTIFASGSTSPTWQWTIPNAMYVSPSTPASENPQVKFTNSQNNIVTLKATDDAGSCSTTSTVTTKPRLPHFQETQPQ